MLFCQPIVLPRQLSARPDRGHWGQQTHDKQGACHYSAYVLLAQVLAQVLALEQPIRAVWKVIELPQLQHISKQQFTLSLLRGGKSRQLPSSKSIHGKPFYTTPNGLCSCPLKSLV